MSVISLPVSSTLADVRWRLQWDVIKIEQSVLVYSGIVYDNAIYYTNALKLFDLSSKIFFEVYFLGSFLGKPLS